MKNLILFFDSGDTIIDESTQIFDETGIVLKAEPFPGAVRVIHHLKEAGYPLALVADGRRTSFQNVLGAAGIWNLFDAYAISDDIGVCKPDPKMFLSAMEQLSLTAADIHRICMIGNNLERDIRGANALGIKSILISRSPRYTMIPSCDSDRPDECFYDYEELPAIIERLNAEIK